MEYLVTVLMVFVLRDLKCCVDGQLHHSKYYDGLAFLRRFGLSLENCKSECLSRSRCDSINFYRRNLLCELNKEPEVTQPGNVMRRPGWLFGRKTDLNQITYRTCKCQTNEKCELLYNRKVVCQKTECDSPEDQIGEYIFHGNVYTIGGKVMASCNKSVWLTESKDNQARYVCSHTGRWENVDVHYFSEIEIFRGYSNLDYGIYAAFILGGKRSTNDTICLQIPRPDNCTLHYRHDDIDLWSSLKVSRVLFTVVKDNIQVQYILFNGVNSSLHTWFEKERVLNSSWSDLMASQQHIFSMLGKVGCRHFPWHTSECYLRRRFVISNKFLNCETTSGWFHSSENPNVPCAPCCDYDNVTSTTLWYSKLTTASVWSRHSDVDKADYISVIILTEK